MKKKIIGILLAVTLTVSQAGIVVYAEDVTWEDEFTQMDEADESETPEADVAWDGESEISETEDDEEQVEVTEEDTEAVVEETNTETEESPEFDKEASDASVYSATHIYKKSGVTLDDAGEYISVYYSSSSQSRIYVCRATKTLEVEHTHTWDEGKITKASTCTKKGTKTFTCTVCGKTRNQEVSVVAHKFTTWKTTTAATALAPAKQTHKCSTCGKTETRNYGNKLKPSIKVNISSILLKTRQKTTLLRVSGLAKGDSIVSWKSSNTNIAKVYRRSNGTCTIQAGTRSGKAIITIALRSGLKKNITVTVQKTTVKTTKITGVATSLKLKRNQKATLKPVLQPLTSGEKITYKSSNTKIAIVNSKGQITARSKGTATITVTSGRKSVRCKVIVN